MIRLKVLLITQKGSTTMARNHKQIDVAVRRLEVMFCSGAALLFLLVGMFAWWGYSFATSMVHDQLTAQNIYFPPKGSPALSAKEYPTLQKYAGQKVDDGFKARAYADDYIGAHLEKVADGKSYAEVSSLAMADPTNETLAKQKATLFQGETLRALLLGNAYAYWLIGTIAQYAAIVCFALGIVMLGVALRLDRTRD